MASKYSKRRVQIFKISLNININITFDAGTNAHMAAISVAAIRVFGGLAAIFLMKRVPRLSPFLIISCYFFPLLTIILGLGVS